MRYMLVVALAASACGGSSPTAPAPVPVPVPPSTITLSGHVTATNGGQALPGLQATLGAATVSTDGSGGFSFQTLPTGALALALTGSSIVPRSVFVAAGSSRSVTVDAISTTGFDLNFYREFARDVLESPLQPLRHWTTPVSIHLQTSDLANAQTMDMVERVAREIVPVWTAGHVAVATVERGSGSRENEQGWLTIQWSDQTDHCGLADVAKSGGVITFYPKHPNCACAGFVIAPTAVRHELGHAMGFYHTDSVSDVMTPGGYQCDQQPSARELAAAAIAYARPVGNLDPDTDGPGSVALAVRRVP